MTRLTLAPSRAAAKVNEFCWIFSYRVATSSDSLTRLGRKKKPRCLALHWRQRYGRKSNTRRIVHSKTPRRCERNTSLQPHSGHRRDPIQSEMACVLAMNAIREFYASIVPQGFAMWEAVWPTRVTCLRFDFPFMLSSDRARALV